MTEPLPLIQLGAAARVGFLSDTHCHQPGAADLPQVVLNAFRGVDLVVHLGDMGDAAVLDRLGAVASVVATRGRDDPTEDQRIAPIARVIEAGGLVIGALFDLASAGLATVDQDRLNFANGPQGKLISKIFARSVEVVAFGATHLALVAHRQGVLFVNPGSPTLRAPQDAGAIGTVAILELRAGVATVEIVRL